MQPVGLRQLPQVFVRALIGLALLLALAATLLLLPERAWGQTLDKPSFVVATSKLDGDAFWKGTVILARPMGAGHVGLVLNKPGRLTLAELFPDHAPSKVVSDPVRIGGPTALGVIFALTKAEASPGLGSVEIMPGLWLATRDDVIDAIIESKGNAAIYFAGYTNWRAGLLEDEIARGLMVVVPADMERAMRRDTSNLYEEIAPAAGGKKRET